MHWLRTRQVQHELAASGKPIEFDAAGLDRLTETVSSGTYTYRMVCAMVLAFNDEPLYGPREVPW